MVGSIPGSRKSLLGHLFVGPGPLFREIWDVLGCVREWFGEIFGWVLEGFEKKSEDVANIKILKHAWECFS